MRSCGYRVLGLVAVLAGAGALQAGETSRHRPASVAGLTETERALAGYASLRIGPGDDDVILLAFLSPGPKDPVTGMVACVPGRPPFASGVRVQADRRRRDDKGPSRFTEALLISTGTRDAPQSVELLDVEKRPRRGKLTIRLRRARGDGVGRVSLELSGVLKQAGGADTLIPELSLEKEPSLRLQTAQNGRRLYAALQCGDWKIVLPGRRPAILVEVLNDRGGVVETASLQPADKPLLQVFDWGVDLRRMQPGLSYTLRATVTPGPGYKPLVEKIQVVVPVIPSF
jgi:hypothetical protein